ncbi:glycoside hydrolase family 95 protein [Roridomyces roridus]|uniref:Glycoside hydrolase family 95 protein n=1 Tax=Roridomyces roridus TaxID=1738132 RepID=A0AAD7FFH9_9AGAR|nr:glycoside hydrolase family 95 protein [Roridomyces roridus]
MAHGARLLFPDNVPELLFVPYNYALAALEVLAMRTLRTLFAAIGLASVTVAAPPGFPTNGNGLWYTIPGKIWSLDYLPVGNGFLAAMTPGGTVQEATQLNIESLWAGGPFQDPTYNGGNKQPSERTAMAAAMQQYRDAIWDSPTGNIDDISTLTTDAGDYGSYVGAGYLVSTLNISGAVTDYSRWLDLNQAIARATWTQAGSTFTRETFCSNPTQACTQHISSTGALPSLSFAFASSIEASFPTPNITCFDSSTLRVQGFASIPGMAYEFLGRVRSTGGHISCASAPAVSDPALWGPTTNATLSVTGHPSEAWISWVGGTDFSQDAGDAAHGFTFRGADPHVAVLALLSGPPSTATYTSLRSAHFTDFEGAVGAFTLDIGQKPQLGTPTDVLIGTYQTDVGNPYLEWLMFNYGRYLLASSARGELPANLQGKWALDTQTPWSGDYHSNINIQMNYWSAEMSNLNLINPLFTYFEKNWAPRGAETAWTLYNVSRGWVTHNEMNARVLLAFSFLPSISLQIFGHTGMKAADNSASWANYPESAVWMMVHVWDHFDYTNDVNWWKSQGWPLIKGVASFHLDKLVPDLRFNDGTLVVIPCNSPEQNPITLGCAHAQQLIWQLFNAVEKGFDASGDTDTAFLEEVRTKRDAMDKGLRIGWWGQLQEWKVDQDMQNDTHRHLSHLIGLYPGYAITNYEPTLQGNILVNGSRTTYTKSEIIDAATVSLIHRGNGTGPDADSGWEKMWRAASWAQLQNATEFYHELTYGIFENFGSSLFSLYDPFDADPIIQIDANLGLPGAILNALLQAPDVPTIATPLVITLLPALPSQWSSGAMKGARVRGGMMVDLQWEGGSPTSASFTVDASVVTRPVQVVHGNKIVASFTTSPGLKKTITSF